MLLLLESLSKRVCCGLCLVGNTAYAGGLGLNVNSESVPLSNVNVMMKRVEVVGNIAQGNLKPADAKAWTESSVNTEPLSVWSSSGVFGGGGGLLVQMFTCSGCDLSAALVMSGMNATGNFAGACWVRVGCVFKLGMRAM